MNQEETARSIVAGDLSAERFGREARRTLDRQKVCMAKRYDLAVIGGGTAGLVSAAGAASLGARVALVERDRLGGDCLYKGACRPRPS